MPRLYHWYLGYSDGGSCLLHGVVTGHPALPDAMQIHTSPVLALTQNPQAPEQLSVQTENTLYDCSMAHCDYESCRGFAGQAAAGARVPDGAAAWLTQLEAFARRYEGAAPETPPPPAPSLLLRLGNHRTYYFDCLVLYPGRGREIQRLTQAFPHVGMFQDSVLCEICDEEEQRYFDLRYFPYRGGNLEFYLWETCDLPLYLENGGDSPLTVRTPQGTFRLTPGQRLPASAENADPLLRLSSTADLYGWEP